MSPAEIKEARLKLGLTQAQLAAALNLSEPYGKDVVRSWESGRRPISGPAQVAITLMLKEQMK
jgi:DNA-binding transcriptional regulator YiaG